MPEVTARVALAVLVVVFAWAAGAKVLRPSSWQRSLDAYALPRPIAFFALWATPIAEAVVVTLALVGRGRAAAVLALILLGGFTGGLLRARALHGERVPCGCFGKTTERPVSLLLWRNAALALCALAVLTANKNVTLYEGWRTPNASEAFPAILVLIGIAVAAWSVSIALTSLRGDRT